jgi:hypothetical protein
MWMIPWLPPHGDLTESTYKTMTKVKYDKAKNFQQACLQPGPLKHSYVPTKQMHHSIPYNRELPINYANKLLTESEIYLRVYN